MNASTVAARIDRAPDPTPDPADYSFDSVAEIFRPIFRRIAEGTLAREQQRRLPFEQVRWLKEKRFGALRVPTQFGGYGLDHRGYLQLLIELAEADPNVAHLFRGHFAVVEEKLGEPDPRRRSIWLERLGRGDIVGNASTEPGDGAVDKKSTRLFEVDGVWQLSGTKFYTTGSIFADWIDASARRSDEEHVSVLVDRNHPGVAITDDWDGFGQRLTGTGTGIFSDVPVEDHAILVRSERLPYLGAVYQTVLLAALAGIARSIANETAQHLKTRQRVYSHGNSDLARDDPQLKQVVGEIAAAAYAVENLVLSTTGRFAEAQAAVLTRNSERAKAAAQAVEIDVNKVQIVIAELVLRSASRLFDALGASAVRLENGLDRHWRNARTILSHNPLVYRARIVGDYHVNDKLPDLAWSVGIASAKKED
jgi:alkylation response protein AidB-like acyl-CoA dehydrogenase